MMLSLSRRCLLTFLAIPIVCGLFTPVLLKSCAKQWQVVFRNESLLLERLPLYFPEKRLLVRAHVFLFAVTARLHAVSSTEHGLVLFSMQTPVAVQ